MKTYKLSSMQKAQVVKKLLIQEKLTKGVQWIYKASMDDWVCTATFQVEQEQTQQVEDFLREQDIYFSIQ